ncbi:OmpA family protein [Ketobacter sp. MCCC 1A13808]|uniref:OmpA family protein n=1 Tax=Ketobacter sp. MCCC 1A13808 TaxID=2602738 RepID=UPI0012EB1B5E|nr:OmpA family protein [Ketobacter sp. MCCC 1A13808]MVF12105.1 OmpA family protein [Ketobacter sp. MCCC 1A13808]
MKNTTSRQVIYISLLASLVGLSSCAQIETVANSMNEKLTSGGSAVAVGGGTYFACKLGGGSDKDCAITAGVIGLATYGYLKHQANQMAKIENVMATPCESSDASKQAYCVNMTEGAVIFSSGSHDLNPQSKQTLNQVANVLKESNNTIIYVEGHTDPVGPEEYNQKLSEDRASAVRSYFESQGLSNERMLTLGWGESKPLPMENPSNSELRRVELRVEGDENG